MEAEICREAKVYTQHYDRGKPKKEKIVSCKQKDKTGTRIVFKPDKEIFSETVFDRKVVAHRLRELAYLNKGVKIIFTDEKRTKS